MNKSLSTIETLKYWTYKILPLVYDDSLSYYELLNKVTYKLNEVIKNNNELPEYIAELLSEDKFREIISSIMDELREQIATANEHDSSTATSNREAGTLVWINDKLYRVTRTILAGDKYVLGSNIEKITIEELIAKLTEYIETELNVNKLNVNGELNVLGDLNLDEANSVKYKTPTPINSFFSKVPFVGSDGGTYNLLVETNQTHVLGDYITPEYFGATGDGVTDDSEALQDFFTYLEDVQSSGKNAYGKLAGKYAINTSIRLSNTYDNGAKIFIDGENGGSIIRTANISLFVAYNDNHYNYVFNGVLFTDPRNNNYNQPIIYNYNICNSAFINCIFTNVNRLLYAPLFCQGLLFMNCLFNTSNNNFIEYAGSFDCHYLNCHFINMSVGVFKCAITDSMSATLYGDNRTTIEYCTFEDCIGNVLYTEGAQVLSFSKNYLERCGKIVLNTTAKNDVYRMTDIVIDNNFLYTQQSLGNNEEVIIVNNCAYNVSITNNMIRNGFVLKANNLATNSYIYLANNDFSAASQNSSGFAHDPVKDHTDYEHIFIGHNSTRTSQEKITSGGRDFFISFNGTSVCDITVGGAPTIGTDYLTYSFTLPFTLSGSHACYCECVNNDNIVVDKCILNGNTLTMKIKSIGSQVTTATTYRVKIYI